MRVDPFPRFPSDVNLLIRKLTDLFRQYADQINGLTEGRISSDHSARTEAPTTGAWEVGDVIRNSAPSIISGSGFTYFVWGWICTVSGTPGTWEELTSVATVSTGSANVGEATLNFGSAPGTNTVTTTVTGEAGILATSSVQAYLMGDSTATHNAYEHEIVPMTITCGNIVAGTGFDIIASSELRLTGTFKVRWSWV